MKKKEFISYIKEHKKEILIGAAVAVGGIALCVIGCKKSKKSAPKATSTISKAVKSNKDIIDLDYVLDVGNTRKIWKENGFINAIIEPIPMTDIGKLGESLIAKIPEVTDDSVLHIVLGVEID